MTEDTYDVDITRRELIGTAGALGATALAGCGDDEDSEPSYNDEADNLIRKMVENIDTKGAASENYVVTSANDAELHIQGDGDLENKYWAQIEVETDEDWGDYTSGGELVKQDVGALGDEISNYVGSINEQVTTELDDEEFQSYKDSYDFKPLWTDENRPRATPGFKGVEITFKGTSGQALNVVDNVPLEEDPNFDKMNVEFEDI